MTSKDKKVIEDSERLGIPIFVLTAKDITSSYTIEEYYNKCSEVGCSSYHLFAIKQRINEFCAWQRDNIESVKIPD